MTRNRMTHSYMNGMMDYNQYHQQVKYLYSRQACPRHISSRAQLQQHRWTLTPVLTLYRCKASLVTGKRFSLRLSLFFCVRTREEKCMCI